MLLNIMMLFLLLGLQFMGTQYTITEIPHQISRQIISALFITMCLLKLIPLSNYQYNDLGPDAIPEFDKHNSFPLPEVFMVMSFSLFLFIEYGIAYKEPERSSGHMEMETIKIMLHMKSAPQTEECNSPIKKFEREKIQSILSIVKAIYSGILMASLDDLVLLVVGGTFVIISVFKLGEEPIIDKIVQLSSATGGFFIGSILLSYGMQFLCVSIVAGYLLYYSTVLIINHDYKINSQHKTKKFMAFLGMSVLTSIIFLI